MLLYCCQSGRKAFEMPKSQSRSFTSRVRSFLVFPLPFLLALAALSFVPKDATAPAFAAQWSATVKFLAGFLAMVSGIIAFQLAVLIRPSFACDSMGSDEPIGLA